MKKNSIYSACFTRWLKSLEWPLEGVIILANNIIITNEYYKSSASRKFIFTQFDVAIPSVKGFTIMDNAIIDVTEVNCLKWDGFNVHVLSLESHPK